MCVELPRRVAGARFLARSYGERGVVTRGETGCERLGPGAARGEPLPAAAGEADHHGQAASRRPARPLGVLTGAVGVAGLVRATGEDVTALRGSRGAAGVALLISAIRLRAWLSSYVVVTDTRLLYIKSLVNVKVRKFRSAGCALSSCAVILWPTPRLRHIRRQDHPARTKRSACFLTRSSSTSRSAERFSPETTRMINVPARPAALVIPRTACPRARCRAWRRSRGPRSGCRGPRPACGPAA